MSEDETKLIHIKIDYNPSHNAELYNESKEIKLKIRIKKELHLLYFDQKPQ